MGGGGIPIVSDAVSMFLPEPEPQQVVYQEPAQQVVDGASESAATTQTAETKSSATEQQDVASRDTGAARRRAASRSRTLLSGSSGKSSILG